MGYKVNKYVKLCLCCIRYENVLIALCFTKRPICLYMLIENEKEIEIDRALEKFQSLICIEIPDEIFIK